MSDQRAIPGRDPRVTQLLAHRTPASVTEVTWSRPSDGHTRAIDGISLEEPMYITYLHHLAG